MNEQVFNEILFGDLDGQLANVQDGVQATLRRVRLGLAAIQVPEEDERLSFPGLAFELTMARWESSPGSEEISDFRSWILGTGFRNLVERTQLHLDWAGSFCKVLQLRKELGLSGIESNTSEIAEKVDTYWEKLHRMNLKPKMDHLRKQFAITTNLDDVVTSAQRARNCLTHRGGWVSEEFDCDENSTLRMVWISPEIDRYSGEDRRNLLQKPSDIGRGGVYLLGWSPGRRAFSPGEKVDFSAREFNDIAITCYFYCREVTLAAVRYGREELGLSESVPELDDDWLNLTAVHLYLNSPDKKQSESAVVVSWKEGRLRLLGVRNMTQKAQENGEE